MKRNSLDITTPIHPGEILSEEFLGPMGITQYRLANAIGVPPIRISQIVRGKRGITADTALRLARYFGTTPEFWMNLQAQHDLESASQGMSRAIADIRPFRPTTRRSA